MLISRRATVRNHGAGKVELDNPQIYWDPKRQLIVFSQLKLKGFTPSVTKHDYQVSVSLEELRQVLDALSDGPALDSPGIVSSALSRGLRALVRLASVCVGIILAPKD